MPVFADAIETATWGLVLATALLVVATAIPAYQRFHDERTQRGHAAATWCLLSTRFRPDTRLDRGGHYVGSHGGCDGRQRRPRPERALRRAGRSPGGRPGGALERAAQAGSGPAVAAGRVPRCARPRDR